MTCELFAAKKPMGGSSTLHTSRDPPPSVSPQLNCRAHRGLNVLQMNARRNLSHHLCHARLPLHAQHRLGELGG